MTGDTKMTQTVIVVPCYNEARRLDLGALIRHALEDLPHRFMLVDDGSSDDTLALLMDLHEFQPERFHVCSLPENIGKAEAVRRGMLEALKLKPQYVGFWDADLATPLEAIEDFVALLERRPEMELVTGARVRLLGHSIERRVVRHCLGRLFAAAAATTLRLPVYDTQCGAKLFRVTPQLMAIFGSPFITNWTFDVEIIARMIQQRRGTELPSVDRVIYEYTLDTWHDVPGSKVRPLDFVRAVHELWAIRRTYIDSRTHVYLPPLDPPPLESEQQTSEPEEVELNTL